MDDLCLTDEDLAAPYLPLPDEIAAGCAEIRSEWSEHQKTVRRMRDKPVETMNVPVHIGRRLSTIGKD